MEFVGREKEIAKIEASLLSDRNEFLAIYGRRRVGKTYLVKKALEDKIDFYYTGIYKQTKNSQLKQFQMALMKYGYQVQKPFYTWFEAFAGLKECLLSQKKKTVCVFIDELPWMDSKNSNFVQAFADFWNMWDSLNPERVILKLYICGSATTWMIRKIIRDKGGLHNRLTDSIHLKQFTMKECESYFREVLKIPYSKMEILDIYMCVGGIPYYLSKFSQKIPVSRQIDELFFSETGSLRDEFQYLYDALFNDSKNYRKIIAALCSRYKGLTREELISLTHIEGGTLSDCLENLENCDFIRKYLSPRKSVKDCLYQITDLYTIFYLKFVDKNQYDQNYWTNMLQTSKVLAWKGFAYERVLFLHIDNIKVALGINGISSNVFSWMSRTDRDEKNSSYQIDMIIDRADNVMNICEIKYSSGKYSLTEEYSNYVSERIEFFRNEIKTKKTLKNTFITTFGVDSPASCLPDISLTLDDIFN